MSETTTVEYVVQHYNRDAEAWQDDGTRATLDMARIRLEALQRFDLSIAFRIVKHITTTSTTTVERVIAPTTGAAE